jgi:hypothetical protein
MKSKIGWLHPVDESDQWDGFNDPGIEHFRGNPILHLAREINQNVLDAGNSESSLVEVSFSCIEVNTAEIPHLKELRDNLKSCQETAINANEGKKAEIFFNTAVSALEQPKVTVLSISEQNTRGMQGPSKNGTPYYAFMKAKGQSKKITDTATGSYGIGKFAPYAVSVARTIFVSTVYQDNDGHWRQLTQGKSILMSHDRDGKRRQGVGFWGVIDQCQPVEEFSPDLPSWLQRASSADGMPTSKGTKITILCFDATENWEDLLAVSVAENFFGAIIGKKLKVNIGSKYSISHETIEAFFNNVEIKNIIKEHENEPEQFDDCRSYLSSLIDNVEVIEEESETRELGLCQVRILLGEGLPKRVCFLRNGMFITSSLNRLRSFSDFKEFVAVVQCKSKKGNELLRAMEPPRHDNFHPDLLSTKEERRRGSKALNELSKWIRDMLKRHAKDPVSDVTDIDELKDFFGQEGAEGTGKGVEDINPSGKVVIRAKPIKVRASAPAPEDAGEGTGSGEGGSGGGGGGGGAGGSGAAQGGSGGGTPKPSVELSNTRSLVKGGKTRTIIFTPSLTGKVALRVLEAGADTDYKVAVVKSSHGVAKNGSVELDVTAGSRCSLEVELNEAYKGAIKVVAYEI